jgi:hypothetical protein
MAADAKSIWQDIDAIEYEDALEIDYAICENLFDCSGHFRVHRKARGGSTVPKLGDIR